MYPDGIATAGDWIAAPLIDRAAIEIASSMRSRNWCQRMPRSAARFAMRLKETFDLTRLLARIATGRTGPRDLQQVARDVGDVCPS
jgi:DNA mismatch repair protein MutS